MNISLEIYFNKIIKVFNFNKLKYKPKFVTQILNQFLNQYI